MREYSLEEINNVGKENIFLATTVPEYMSINIKVHTVVLIDNIYYCPEKKSIIDENEIVILKKFDSILNPMFFKYGYYKDNEIALDIDEEYYEFVQLEINKLIDETIHKHIYGMPEIHEDITAGYEVPKSSYIADVIDEMTYKPFSFEDDSKYSGIYIINKDGIKPYQKVKDSK